LLGSSTLNIGTISGGVNINAVPDKAEIGVHIRIVPGKDRHSIEKEIRLLLGKDVEIALIQEDASIATDESNNWTREVFDITRIYLEEPPTAGAASYFTDASVFTPFYSGVPTIILGPGDPAVIHQTDEYCNVSRIEEAISIYTDIAKKWCLILGSDKS